MSRYFMGIGKAVFAFNSNDLVVYIYSGSFPRVRRKTASTGHSGARRKLHDAEAVIHPLYSASTSVLALFYTELFYAHKKS